MTDRNDVDLDAEINLSALTYHELPQPGKIAIQVTKPNQSQRNLSLAYTPGVAEPVRQINADAQNAYRYTAKGNLVGVITDGSAVLGLGNVGALAGKPVMEGKAVLFKHFADEEIPAEVLKAYGLASLAFGPDYIIPKPLDPRLKERISAAVAQAAIDSGVAQAPYPAHYPEVDS